MKHPWLPALSALCCVLAVAGCKPKEPEIPESERGNFSQIESDNPEMVAAISEARQKLPDFLTKLEASKDNRNFSLKVKFPGRDGMVEHIWVGNLEKISATRYSGVLDNEPVYLDGKKLGSPVEFDLDDVSDWIIYHDDGTTEGAFTQKVLEKAGR